MAESEAMNDEHWETPDDEEGLIRHYFFRGFKYEEIRMFLMKYHDIEMSLSTLKRRIKRMVYEGSYQITRSVT